jgi:3-oxoacyl-ACP reductase-like protein
MERCTAVSEQKDEGFKVIDRRPFTSEGEIRKEVVEEQEREAKREEVKEAKAAAANQAAQAEGAVKPAADAPKRSAAFENLIRMIGSNAAMVLGAYADPNTGQPMIDPDAAQELISMLDALKDKTKGNLAPEENEMLTDLLGKLKLTYLEVQKAMAAEMAKVTAQAKGKR